MTQKLKGVQYCAYDKVDYLILFINQHMLQSQLLSVKLQSNMNYLDSATLGNRRPTSRLPEPKKDRIFGKDLTNVITDRNKLNQSIQQNHEKFEKPEVRAKSKSFAVQDPTPARDVAYEYQTDIMNEILKDNKPRKAIKSSVITLRMRAILVDWLVDVHSQFQLKEETLSLGIRLLDDYLSLTDDVNKKTLQLIGISCLWMASKYQEIYPPRISNYVSVTDNTYTKNDIHDTEAKIIETLNFEILKTTPLQYLSLILGSQYSNTTGSFCKYLVDLCNLEFITCQYSQSVIVLTCLEMCERLLKQKTSIKKFKELFKVDQDQINKCFKHMCKLITSSSWEELNAIKRKYCKEKFHSVGKIKLEKI